MQEKVIRSIARAGEAVPPVPPEADRLLTIEEASEYLRTTPSTMRYWHSIGKGPRSFKLGVRRLWRKSALDAYIPQTEAAQNEDVA